MIPAYPDWLDADAWSEFLAMRKRIKMPLTDYGQKLAMKKLDELRLQGNDPTAVLEEAIFRQWRGLFAVVKAAAPTSPAQLSIVPTRIGQAWNLSNEGIVAKAKQCGIAIGRGDSFEAIKERVQAFLDDPRQRGAM